MNFCTLQTVAKATKYVKGGICLGAEPWVRRLVPTSGNRAFLPQASIAVAAAVFT